jgi:hypothetical protein
MNVRTAARAAAVALTLTLTLLGAAPAHATSPYVYNFKYPDYGVINAVSDTDAWACMNNDNFHTVWTEVDMTRQPYIRYVYAYIKGTCGYTNFDGTGYIIQFRFCVDTLGCTAWKASVPGS